MAVQKVDVVFGVPKEGKELVDLMMGILADAVAKKSVMEIGNNNLAKLLAAVDGVSGISEEFKSDGKDELIGYLTREFCLALKI